MEKKGEKRTILVLILFLVISVLLVSIASAGWIDNLKKILGKAISQPFNVSVTISGTSPVNITVWNSTLTGTAVDPTEEGIAAITFNVTVLDSDGATDINDSSVLASVYLSGQSTRYNTTACTPNTGQSTTTSKNYTCSVAMWYWDLNGTWTVNVSATDYGNKTTIINNSNVFYYDVLQAIKIDPPLITWQSVVQGAQNQTPNNNMTINNTGNANLSGKIAVEGHNLYSGTNMLNVANFSASIFGGTPSVQCNSTANTLSNGTNVTITGTILNRGNLSASEANETLHYCLRTVPTSVPSGTYDTYYTGGQWWVHIVLSLALFIPCSKLRNKKRKKMKRKIMIGAITLFAVVLTVVALTSSVLAFGVASSGTVQEVYPGQSKIISVRLQNMPAGADDVSAKVTLVKGSEIATISTTEYLVKGGTKDTEVFINVTIPPETPINTTYLIMITTTTSAPGAVGGVAFGIGIDTIVDVLVVPEPTTIIKEIAKFAKKNVTWIVVVLIVLLAAILLIVLRKLKRKAFKK